MVDLATAVSTLNQLVTQLDKRRPDVVNLDNAYRGDFKLHYASSNFREYFATRYKDFADNWCQIVADAPHERLEVTGIRLPGATKGDADLWRSWVENDADQQSDLAMLDAIVAKRSYALVWGRDDDEATITFEHPAQCIVGYDPETRARRAGAKVWRDGDTDYATLYLPDEVWKFERKAFTDGGIELPASALSAFGWKPREDVDINPLPNPLGKVPLVELPNRPRLVGEPSSDIQGTLAMQHAINLLWAQLFTSSDEATIGQRLIVGAEPPKVPVLNAEGDSVGEKTLDLKKFRNDSVAFITDPTAKPHQWQAAKLDVFTDVIEIAVGHIAAQTRTPAHYLLIGGTIANVSGDAMKALETGLVKRTHEKTQHFGRAIRDVFELVALARDDGAKAEQVRRGRVLWADIESRSDAQRADALLKKRDIGYPFEYLLELDGLGPDEVSRVVQLARNAAADPVLMALAQGNRDDAAATADG